MDPRPIILCADDFGQSPGISQGILKLVSLQRLSAVSCMVNTEDFPTSAPELAAIKGQTKLGMHFSLTEGPLLSQPEQPCFKLNKLLIKSHLRMISTSLIRNEFNAQLDHYLEVMGSLPDFIDGHQHVHQFPGIRHVLLDIYKQRLQSHGTSIRSTYPAVTLAKYHLKAHIIAISGGMAMNTVLKRKGIPHNHFFAGVYDFSPQTNYRNLFRQWLHLAPSNTLIMCHPAQIVDVHDPLAQTRVMEFNYFTSEHFLDDCRESHVVLF